MYRLIFPICNRKFRTICYKTFLLTFLFIIIMNLLAMLVSVRKVETFRNDETFCINEKSHPRENCSKICNQPPNLNEIMNEWRYTLESTYKLAFKNKDLCPDVNSILTDKPQSICLEPNYNLTDLSSSYTFTVNGNGAWEPSWCKPRYYVAVVIPFRNRTKHLISLLSRLHPLLQKQLLKYKIIVAEQSFSTKYFNRGMMKNIGFALATGIGLNRESLSQLSTTRRTNINNSHRISKVPNNNLDSVDCVIFHDVDLVPESPNNMYYCPNYGTGQHYIGSLDIWKYTAPYGSLVGGVLGIRTEDFAEINGFSNFYFLWGGEDDDLFNRLKFKGYKLKRAEELQGRYRMLSHHKDKKNPYRMKLLMDSSSRMFEDGLMSMKYHNVKIEISNIYSKIKVDLNESEILRSHPEGQQYLEWLVGRKPYARPFMWRWVWDPLSNIGQTLESILDPFNAIHFVPDPSYGVLES